MAEYTTLPKHIGFIMDGNGRWAERKGLMRTAGHAEGANAFRKIARECRKMGIRNITFYAFSTENWKRPKAEIDTIMKLFRQYLDEAEDFAKDNTRLIFLGDKAPFDAKMRERMIYLEKSSENFDGMTLAIAMNYGGRDDIVYASRKAAQMVKDGFISPDEIDEKLLGSMLYTGAMPDVDLLIRPGGEKRISNFLIWQCSYAEFYFTDVLWPDFTVSELKKALDEYNSRKRRFGGV
jgi:undecaprenyl diphosphate synthase